MPSDSDDGNLPGHHRDRIEPSKRSRSRDNYRNGSLSPSTQGRRGRDVRSRDRRRSSERERRDGRSTHRSGSPRHHRRHRSRSRSRYRHSRSPRRHSHRHDSRSPPRTYRTHSRRSPSPRHRRTHHDRNRSPPNRSPPPRRRSPSPPQRAQGSVRERFTPPLHNGYHEGRGRGEGLRGGYPPHDSRARGGVETPPEVGTIHHATVASVRPFGVFVELPGFRKQGLVHHSQISDEIRFGRDDDDETKVKALEFFLPRGEKAWVKVTELRQEEGRDPRIGCSMRGVDQETGEDLDPQNLLAGARGGGGGGPRGHETEEPPEVGTVHAATVQSLRPFGVFVKLEGFRKYGLVHVSQISDHMDLSRDDTDEEKTAAIGSVLAIGEKVFVKVVEVKEDERGPKVGCSIKLVSQRDGTDLDPHNLKFRPRPEGGGGPQGRDAIGAHAAEAHDSTVEWGHLKADVVQYGTQGRQYEILGDESPVPRRQAPAGRAPPPARAQQAQHGGSAALPARGRGRGSVLPAWMTGGAPGAPPPEAGGAGEPMREEGQGISSVEDALAILEQFGKGNKHSSKSKKDKKKKRKKEKKDRKQKRKKHKKERRHEQSGSSSSSSDSE